MYDIGGMITEKIPVANIRPIAPSRQDFRRFSITLLKVRQKTCEEKGQDEIRCVSCLSTFLTSLLGGVSWRG
jgi:hypothetical protein